MMTCRLAGRGELQTVELQIDAGGMRAGIEGAKPFKPSQMQSASMMHESRKLAKRQHT